MALLIENRPLVEIPFVVLVMFLLGSSQSGMKLWLFESAQPLSL